MFHRCSHAVVKALAVATLATLGGVGLAAPFTAGNVVVLRLGDGTQLLASNEAAPVFLDEYTPAGALVQTIAMPTTPVDDDFALTLHGAETAVGGLNLSGDGHFLTLGGYNTAVGTTGLSATNPATTARVIALVDSDGVVDTTTTITDGFARIANAITVDGTEFWTSGNNQASGPGGVRHSAALGATTSTQVVSAPNNLLMLQIFGGQLYTGMVFGGAGLGAGVASVGTGLPTAASTSITLLPGFPSDTTGRTVREYFFADALTIYIADANAGALGGLQKWTFDGANWIEAGAPFPYKSPTDALGIAGLTGTVDGANITLYATSIDSGATTGNSLVKFESTDGGATFTSSVLAASPEAANKTLFRGVAFAPEPEPSSVESWYLLN